jgi:hypothetical protein
MDHREVVVEYLEKKAELDQMQPWKNNNLYEYGI